MHLFAFDFNATVACCSTTRTRAVKNNVRCKGLTFRVIETEKVNVLRGWWSPLVCVLISRVWRCASVCVHIWPLSRSNWQPVTVWCGSLCDIALRYWPTQKCSVVLLFSLPLGLIASLLLDSKYIFTDIKLYYLGWPIWGHPCELWKTKCMRAHIRTHACM